MKNIHVFVFLILASNISCQLDNPVQINYCEMLTKDQSHVDFDYTDPQVVKSNVQQRKEIFLENYKQIIALTKQEGFPNINFDSLPQDSCKYWAITATLIHMAQAWPDVFFTEETISLLKKEMEEGNLESEDLTPAFRISFHTNEFCDNLEPLIKKAIDTWEMKPHLDSEPRFKKCDE